MASATVVQARPVAPRLVISAATILVAVALLGTLRVNPRDLPVVVSVYWADVVLLAGTAFWFLHVRGVCWTGELRWIAHSGLWSLVLITVAIVGSSAFPTGAVPVQESLIQVIRFFVYGALLVFMSDVAIRSRVDWQRIAAPVVAIAVGANIVIVGVQLLDPPVLGPAVYALWGDEKLRTLASGYPRVYGTFFNANWFGVFVAWGLTYVVASYRVLAARPIRFGLSVAALMLLIIVSGSRTGILATASGVAVSGMLLWRPGQRERTATRPRTKISLIIVAAAVVGAVVTILRRLDLDRFIRRFTELAMLLSLSEEAEVATLSARLNAWQNALEMFQTAPIFGVGGSTATTGLAPHNGYLAMLMNFGVVGAAALAAFVLGVCFLAWSRLGRDAESRRLQAWFFGFTVALSVAMLAGDFVYTSRLVFLWLLIVALVAGQASWARLEDPSRRGALHGSGDGRSRVSIADE
jgi:O-antigen ligase